MSTDKKDMHNNGSVDSERIDSIVSSISEMVAEGASVSQVADISKEEMEEIYRIGYNLYQAGSYEKAVEIFQFLVVFDHLEPRFWIALATTMKTMGDHQNAIACFGAVALIQFTPNVGFLMAQSYIALGDFEGARESIKAAKNIAEAGGDKEAIKMADSILESIENAESKSAKK